MQKPCDFAGMELKKGKYKINDDSSYFINKGAFGQVFKGKIVKTNQTVAIKQMSHQLLSSETDKKAFEKELMILVNLF